MKNCEIIEHEIAELEGRQIDYSTAEKLAWLYIVRDHIKRPKGVVMIEEPEEYTEKREVVVSDDESRSEFMQAVEGKDLEKVLKIIDETMSTLQTTLPRIYNCVLSKLKEI